MDGLVLNPVYRDAASPRRVADSLLRWHLRNAVLANMKGAEEPQSTYDFSPGSDLIGQIMAGPMPPAGWKPSWGLGCGKRSDPRYRLRPGRADISRRRIFLLAMSIFIHGDKILNLIGRVRSFFPSKFHRPSSLSFSDAGPITNPLTGLRIFLVSASWIWLGHWHRWCRHRRCRARIPSSISFAALSPSSPLSSSLPSLQRLLMGSCSTMRRV